MKLYITEYKTKEGVNRCDQSHTPKLPDKIIGDMIEVTRFQDTELRCLGCGETHRTYTTEQYEIVEIRQYVKELPSEERMGLIEMAFDKAR